MSDKEENKKVVTGEIVVCGKSDAAVSSHEKSGEIRTDTERVADGAVDTVKAKCEILSSEKTGESFESAHFSGKEAGSSFAENAEGRHESSSSEKISEESLTRNMIFRQMRIKNLLWMIDYDCTSPTMTTAEISDCAKQAQTYGLKSVCILASRMKNFKNQAKNQCFCAVVAYPSGEMASNSKILEIKDALKNGASEIDVFFRVSALRDEKPRAIIKTLKKYRKVIGDKHVFKLSVDSSEITNEEAKFIADAAKQAHVDFIVVRNCAVDEIDKQIYYASLRSESCRIEFVDNVWDYETINLLNYVGSYRFLLKNALVVADRIRDSLKNCKYFSE